jgi:hypothetical protein
VVAKVPGRRVPAKPATEPKNGKTGSEEAGQDRDQHNQTKLYAIRPMLSIQARVADTASPRLPRQEMLAVPVDSRAFAMYQSGPVAEKS